MKMPARSSHLPMVDPVYEQWIHIRGKTLWAHMNEIFQSHNANCIPLHLCATTTLVARPARANNKEACPRHQSNNRKKKSPTLPLITTWLPPNYISLNDPYFPLLPLQQKSSWVSQLSNFTTANLKKKWSSPWVSQVNSRRVTQQKNWIQIILNPWETENKGRNNLAGHHKIT